PSVTASRDGVAYAAAHSGWNNTDVTASYTASDNAGGAGLDSAASGAHVFDQEGADQSVTFTVFDLAGNSRSATVAGVKIDKTAPTLTQSFNDPAATGWYNLSTGTAVITYQADDNLSGVSTPAAYQFGEGANLSRAGITVADVAGNVSEATADV